MTKLLERAFKEASRLPDVEQDALAKWVLEELEAEGKWRILLQGLKISWINLLMRLLLLTIMEKQNPWT